eukprot:788725-Prymnesium_polylepis.1
MDQLGPLQRCRSVGTLCGLRAGWGVGRHHVHGWQHTRTERKGVSYFTFQVSAVRMLLTCCATSANERPPKADTVTD